MGKEMNTQTNSASEILFYAIWECRTQQELTHCACQIHLVCASGSDTERELIHLIASKEIALELSHFGNN
jgi:hypothetical protein